MNPVPATLRVILLALFSGFGFAQASLSANAGERIPIESEVRIVEIQGTVELSPRGASTWVLTQTNQVLHPFDRLRTATNSRVTLRWSDSSVVPFGALAEIEILPPHAPEAEPGLHILRGVLSFFHRGEAGRIRTITRGAVAGIEGTEFVVEVNPSDPTETTISVIDGTVSLTNDHGALVLTNGQRAICREESVPLLTAGFIANNVLQWCFYYPAVLDLLDLPLSVEEQQALSSSLTSYRSGDLLQALAQYPPGRQPASDSEKIYYGALLLSVGQVKQTEDLLSTLSAGEPSDRPQRLAASLRQLVAAVKRQPDPASSHGLLGASLPTELLAASYFVQSQANGDVSLHQALKLAREATLLSPEFGFAWARVAELEFSFARTRASREALQKALAFSSRNAQAISLGGFLLTAENKTTQATAAFNSALTIDSALGNAWLGRGLCRIHQGDSLGGREDLLVAAALEPQRSALRSYLGKAFANNGDLHRATKELDLARRLDENDPTPWLYSALLRQQENRINEAVTDLEKSQELNNNRGLYRSSVLLDQDRAVRSANLAAIYQDAGMVDVSIREAARAVSYDYASYSAHLFLSESFNALRDPTRFNLRYETPWFNELLLANLLSPVGATPLSQNISQQEYSRLFDQDHIGISTWTEYRSDGEIHELASQFGTIGNTGWSLDLDYQHNNGVRVNNGLDRIEWYSSVKQQLTPEDSLLLLIKYQDYSSGDNFQYFDPTNARPFYKFDEYQHPILVAGFHHEWQPGVHSMFLGGRLENDQLFSDRATLQTVLDFGPGGVPYYLPATNSVEPDKLDVQHETTLEIYTAEAQQIFENDKHALLLGARWQGGDFHTHEVMSNPAFFTNEFPNPPVNTNVTSDFEWVSAYVYETLKLPLRFNLTAGMAYEYIQFPQNFRFPPIESGEATRNRFNPKLAAVWQITPEATLRGVYARSLGGVSLDESFRLEPTQLAGFSQSFRTIIPESLAGSVSAPEHEVWGGALDLKLPTRTYIGLVAEELRSDVRQTVGVFSNAVLSSSISPFSTPQQLNYVQKDFRATVNQLLSDQWTLGVHYSFTESDLDSSFPALSEFLLPYTISADMHQAGVSLFYHHSSGFFAQAGWDGYYQTHSKALVNPNTITHVADQTFDQVNLLLGYRFPRQRGDLTIGVLNLLDQDYHLNPVTPYGDLPTKRVFYARFRLRF